MQRTNLQNSNDFSGEKFHIGLDVFALLVLSLTKKVNEILSPPAFLLFPNSF
jgi:hypothetical protein